MNRLILILYWWLLKNTLVITSNWTNPESAPAIDHLETTYYNNVLANTAEKVHQHKMAH